MPLPIDRLVARFNPKQPRGPDGEWIDVPGDGSVTAPGDKDSPPRTDPDPPTSAKEADRLPFAVIGGKALPSAANGYLSFRDEKAAEEYAQRLADHSGYGAHVKKRGIGRMGMGQTEIRKRFEPGGKGPIADAVIDRLRAAKFDENKVNRDKDGKFSDKPGIKGPDMPSGGSSGGSSSRRKKKTRGHSLPDPGPPPKPGDKKQVAEIEQALDAEALAAADALNVGLPKGNGFERAKYLIREISKRITETASKVPGSLKKKFAALETAAITQIDKVADLDPKDYYEIPEAAFHYLHLFAEHSEVIHEAIEHNPFTEAENDEIHAGMNWVEKAGGLPRYIKEIADALQRDHGYTESRAIATAVNRCKKWCAGVGNVHPDTRAKACAAVAEWEAKKAGRKVAEAGDDDCGCGSATPPEVANRAADVMFG